MRASKRIIVLILISVLMLNANSSIAYYGQESNINTFGFMQSPINIDTSKLKGCSGSAMRAEFYESDVLVNEHGENILNQYPGSTLMVYDIFGQFLVYHSLQYHWHKVSEHTINGANAALELHIVHQLDHAFTNKQTLSVISIMFEQSETSESSIFNNIDAAHPQSIIKSKIGLALKTAVNQNQTYYHYRGSLTTPNFNEVVNWFVVAEVQKVSHEVFQSMSQHINQNHTNNRAVQALNGRNVYKITPKCVAQSFQEK